MPTILNAQSGVGLTQTADGSGIVKLQSNGVTTNALAWVNFNGTTSPGTIRSQYNVSSVTKNGTGEYTLNFTNAMTDANYALVGTCYPSNGAVSGTVSVSIHTLSTASARFWITSGWVPGYYNAVANDSATVCVAIFGN